MDFYKGGKSVIIWDYIAKFHSLLMGEGVHCQGHTVPCGEDGVANAGSVKEHRGGEVV